MTDKLKYLPEDDSLVSDQDRTLINQMFSVPEPKAEDEEQEMEIDDKEVTTPDFKLLKELCILAVLFFILNTQIVTEFINHMLNLDERTSVVVKTFIFITLAYLMYCTLI
jgi:hypothetical protein